MTGEPPLPDSLPRPLHDQVRAELDRVFAGQQVVVRHFYEGYSPPSAAKLVLGVEVQGAAGRRTHIVKLGTHDEVGRDTDGWGACTGGREVASRVFVAPRPHDLGGGRVAVVYPDAYALFGPDRDRSRPESLEDVARRAVNEGTPDALSVERALAHIYTDLARWFYPGAAADAGRARAFYRERLGKALGHWVGAGAGADLTPAIALHADLLRAALGREQGADARTFGRDRRRQELRRDAVWLLGNCDPPDDLDDFRYLDPYEHVTWALACGALPPTLVGRGHGDLHGRNVLLAVLRHEADYPAVFDYGEMSPDNVLAWDFVKMETELKARLLAELYDDEAARQELLAGRPRRAPGRVTTEAAAEAARRAGRLEFAYAFEKRLAGRTAGVESAGDAGLLRPCGGPPDGFAHPKLGRLLALLLRLRREAALCLGFAHGRPDEWRDEYYFALAVYGLSTAKWNYEPRQTECALVSAGVAVAQMQQARDAIRRQASGPPAAGGERPGRPAPPAEGAPPEACDDPEDYRYPSYRVLLAVTHKHWKAGRCKEALARLEPVLPLYEHAVPLQQEYALLLAEEGRPEEARQLLEPLRELCRVFGDHETLSRIGRLYKKNGDTRWDAARLPFADLPQSAAGCLYDLARLVYEEAFGLTGHYYPGVNAATLALLLGDAAAADRLAGEVIASCKGPYANRAGEERLWVFLSRGEALLVRGNGAAAAGFYGLVLDDLDLDRVGIAQSAYDQVCRLWHAVDKVVLIPVLDAFAARPLWAALKPGPVGDCGGLRTV